MLKLPIICVRPTARITPTRVVRPTLESLEGRLLLYSTLGAQWTFDSRITYSFMPDGTNVGGVASSLFSTLNAVAPTATWQAQFEQAASLWETAANVNLALVPDGGQPDGTNGDQQDDPRFGDIRIGAVPLPAGVLAETFLPPPSNGGTDAGDILFNSTATWAINSTYDVMTVAAHEFGHALGLGDSSVTSAVMYGSYNGINQALNSDDIAGIDSIYGAHQYDAFNSGGARNSTFLKATNITSYINGQSQIALAGLDNTYPSDSEWYVVTVPSSTTGQMTITLQSSNLSSFAPDLMVYNSSFGLLTSVAASTTYGATITATIPNVVAGQKYNFKVLAGGSMGTVGAYGLLLNFGSQAQSPIAPPNTVVPQQPDQGSGVSSNAIGITGSNRNWPIIGATAGALWSTVGNLSGWVALMNAPATATWNTSHPDGTAVAAATQTSLAPSGESSEGASMGALASFSTTAAAPTTTSLTGDSSTGQDSTTVTAAPLPNVDVVFQAVDLVLGGWKGHHKRPSTAAPKKHHF